MTKQQSVADWFDQTYRLRGNSYLRPKQAYYIFLRMLGVNKGQKILDVACGLGRLLEVAIENEYLSEINQVHALAIPTGYEVDYLPKNISINNDVLDFSIKYKKTAGEVTATQQIIMKKLYVPVKDFPAWNQAVSIISPAYKEQVVLKKKL